MAALKKRAEPSTSQQESNTTASTSKRGRQSTAAPKSTAAARKKTAIVAATTAAANQDDSDSSQQPTFQLTPLKNVSYEVIKDPSKIKQRGTNMTVTAKWIVDGKYEFRCLTAVDPITSEVTNFMDFKVIRCKLGGITSYLPEYINVPFPVVKPFLVELKNLQRLITRDCKLLLMSDAPTVCKQMVEACTSQVDIDIQPMHDSNYEDGLIRFFQRFPYAAPGYPKLPRTVTFPAVKYLNIMIRCFTDMNIYRSDKRMPD